MGGWTGGRAGGRGTILYEPPSTKDVRFPGRKLAFSANYQEDYIGILPVGRSRFKVVPRDQFAACQETTTHMPNFTGVPMRSLWHLPKLTKEDKAALTGVAAKKLHWDWRGIIEFRFGVSV